MIDIYDADTGALLGTISQAQMQFLVDQLEEESMADQDYYISRDTLDNFEDEGCPKDLMAFLRGALGKRDDMEIRWARE